MAQTLSSVGAAAIDRLEQTEVAPAAAPQSASKAKSTRQPKLRSPPRLDPSTLAAHNEQLRQALTESLEYQTAISEVLGVISRTPSDLQTIMDVIAEYASRVCGRCDAAVYRVDGDVLRPFARTGSLPWGATTLRAGAAITRGTVVGRALLERRTVHVEDLLAELDQFPDAKVHQREAGHRTTLAAPLLRDETVLGVIMLRRNEVKPFSANEIRILETFADQAVIAIENARLFEAEQARTKEVEAKSAELAQSLEYQTAISDVLGVISRSSTEIKPVLATIAETAMRLCTAANAHMFELRDGAYHLSYSCDGTIDTDLVKFLRANPISVDQVGSVSARAARVGKAVHVPDIALDPEYGHGPLGKGPQRAVLSVPLMRSGLAAGIITLHRSQALPFTDRQIKLVETFADQAVIAIENARLFAETQDALARQTASADILRVISQSPTDATPVFDAIVDAAVRLLASDSAFALRTDGKTATPMAGATRAGRISTLPPSMPVDPEHNFPSRAIVSKLMLHLPDWSTLALPPFEQDVHDNLGLRSAVFLPMVRGNECLGVLVFARHQPRAFTAKEIILAESFRDQAVIAIENARLFEAEQARTKELTESLEYQTATSEVLGVISRSPNELQPVVEAIVSIAAELCEGFDATILMRDGNRLHKVAHHGPITMDLEAMAVGRGWITGRAVLDGKPVHVHDLANAEADFPEGYALHQRHGHRTGLAVPLLKDGAAIGAFMIRRMEVRPFSDKQIALLQTFADQAVIAMNNARLFEEVQARTKELTESLEYQTATSEVLSVISKSPNDLQPVFDVIALTARRLCETSGAGILMKQSDGRLRLVAIHDPDMAMDYGAQLAAEPLRPERGSITGRTALEGRVVHVHNVQEDPEFTLFKDGSPDRRRTMLGVPLLREHEVIGVIILTRTEVKPFTRRQIDLVSTFSDQAAIAINNVRLFQEVQTRTKELTEALEYQTATSEVLSVISRSPNELQPVLEAIAQTAARLCQSDWANVWRLEDGGFTLAVSNDPSPDSVAYLSQNPIPTGRGSLAGRCVLEKRTIHIEDRQTDTDLPLTEQARFTQVRTMLGVPLMRQGLPIGAVTLIRREVRPFSERQIELVETFADQAVIAINNVGLFEEVQARTKELTESLEYQTATSEVLSVISRSPDKLQPVLDAISTTARELCKADRSYFYLLQTGQYHMAAASGAPPEVIADLKSKPRSPGDRGSLVGRAVVDRRTHHLPDAAADPEFNLYDPHAQGRARTSLGVPLLRSGSVVGVIVIARVAVAPFTARQIALVETFANQAVIAINNVGLFEEVQARTKEVQESLEYQTAISDVLGVISKSPNQLQPVFDTIVETAAHLCEAERALIYRFDGHVLRIMASQNTPPDVKEYIERNPLTLSRGSAAGRASIDRRAIHIHDVLADPEYTYGVTQVSPIRTALAIPMLREHELLGVIVIYRHEVLAFTDRHIALMETFADQAVIAINNVGLFEEVQARTKELTESLEYQTATSDVLSVISRSPNELQPVLDAIVEAAVRLCGADHAVIRHRSGENFVVVASHGFAPQELDFIIRAPVTSGSGSVVGRVAQERKTTHIEDVLEDPGFIRKDVARGAGFRTMVAVPLLREGEVIGVLVLTHSRVRSFMPRQVELAETFADQAVIAISNTRLFEEVQARTKELARSVEELKSLGEVGQAVSSTLDMGTVLQTVLENAARMAFASGGTIYVYDAQSQQFLLEAGYNMSEEHTARVKSQPIRMGEPVVGECAQKRAAVQIEDLALADRSQTPLLDILMRAGVRSILALPLLHQGEVIGALVVRRTYPSAFTPETVRLLEAFAAQSAIAVNNARLFKEVEETGRALAVASQHKSQFVANMSHELRTPLAAMLGYTELLRDGTFGELPEKSVRIVDRVQVNGKHLLGLINTVLDISKIEAGQFSLNLAEYSLTSLIETVRVGTESLATEKLLALVTEVTSGLPRGFGDEQRLAQVLLNLVGNAIKFTDRGEVRINARAEEGRFLITVRDTGPGIPPEEQSRIFEEFHQVDNSSTRAKGGTGLGLAIAKKIVDMHGGSIRVESASGAGAAFHLALPIMTPRL